MPDPRALAAIGFVLLVLAIVFSTTTWEIEEEEIYYTQESYLHEEQPQDEKQVTKWPLPWQNATQVQYSVTNTDVREGTFLYKFYFDNGEELKSKKVEVNLLAGESEIITVDSPLAGISTVKLEVVPPYKSVPHTRTVTKKVNIWQYLPKLLPLVK